ncbi:hypothetical protein GUJ93_ZPchr0013g37359 [Zizania palustris]|uniref:Protein TIFY n=1 Tax=Zizania palustris TaxID=103762 RepID=A0A8J5X5M5_ZIZPA|nr:hypothetical protein GUJ93_ZPchr0013g37359 [Zizania palustris]
MAEGRRAGGGGEGDGVELSLRLRTGDRPESSTTSAAAAAASPTPAVRRSMTIFYNGRVCAVEVTELQARTIISLANHESSTKPQQKQVRDNHHYHQAAARGSGITAQRFVAGSSQDTAAPEPVLAPEPSPRQGLEAAAMAAVPVINQAATGLSMKRSLQQFLEKRKMKATTAAPPYAGDRPAQLTRRQ